MTAFYPLSDTQTGIWMEQQLFPESRHFNYLVGLRCDHPLSESGWRRAVALFWESQDGLRLAVSLEHEQVRQTVLTDLEPELVVIDLSSDADAEDKIAPLLKPYSQRQIPLSAPRPTFFLVHLPRQTSALFWLCHHYTADGWSFYHALDTIRQVAQTVDQGETIKALPFHSFLPYLEKEARYESNSQSQIDRDFWRRATAEPAPPLLQTPPGPETGYHHRALIDAAREQTWQQFCRTHNLTLFQFLINGAALYFGRRFNRSRYTMAMPLLNRSGDELKTHGLYVKVSPWTVDLNHRGSFLDFAAENRKTLREAQRHQRFSYRQLDNAMDIAKAMQGFSFSYLPYNGEGQPLLMDRPGQTHAILITLFATEEGKASPISLETRADLFGPREGERILEEFLGFIGRLTTLAERPLADIEAAILEPTRSQTRAHTNPIQPLHSRLDHIFKTRAEAVALQFGEHRLTYRQVDQKSRRAAHGLSQAVNTGDMPTLAIAMKPSIEYVLTVLAAARAGITYLTLNPEYPESRLRELCRLSNITTIISDENQGRAIRRLPGQHLNFTQLLQGDPNFQPKPRAVNHPLNIVFTSGSTGTPKGAVLPTVGLLNFVDALSRENLLGSGETIARISNIAFDFSTYEIWGSLLSGARLVHFERELVLQPTEFSLALRREGVTTTMIPTALFHLAVRLQPDCFATMKTLIVGGEPANPELFRIAMEASPNLRLYNAYGPTEASIFNTLHLLQEPPISRLPIGRALSGNDIYVCDSQGRAMPVDGVGEIMIGGPGLAFGYLHQPRLTAERFVPHPYRSGMRLYRTGDLGKITADGQLHIFGRQDNQVKIRGHRVELEDVEISLAKHEKIRQVSVIAVDDGLGGKQLAAFLVLDQTYPLQQLNRDLSATLMPYMVPEHLRVVEKLPLNANGKVDKKALAKQFAETLTETQHDTTSPLENQILNLWRSHFHRDDLKPNTHFSDIGGSSLTALSLAAKMSAALNRTVHLRDIFKFGTVRALATALEPSSTEKQTVLDPETYQYLIHKCNQTQVPYPQTNLFAAFAATVEKYGEHIALANADSNITYDDLYRKIIGAAQALQSQFKLQPGDHVGIQAESSPNTAALLFACLAVGAVAVPLSPEFPENRMQLIHEDCHLKAIIQEDNADSLNLDVPCISQSQIFTAPGGSFKHFQAPGNFPAVIYYTSGSTGKPKGAVITHLGILRLHLNSFSEAVTPGKTWLQSSQFTFDAALFDTFIPLLRGARLFIINKQELLDPETLESIFREQSVKFSLFTTAYFNLIANLRPEIFRIPEQVYIAGEKASSNHIRNVLRCFDPQKSNTTFYNFYGPTEVTVFTNLYSFQHIDSQEKDIPVGPPAVNSSCYILDPELEPIAPGNEGELFLGGDGLAQAYINRPALTAERFIPNPFGNGDRLYRTGDRALWNHAGQVIIKGRIDQQIKIRGHRIEPGEIAYHLTGHPGIKTAHVTAYDGNEGKELAAFLITDQAPPDPEPEAWLSERLPTWMLPHKYLYLDHLPLTANGKVDNRALLNLSDMSLREIPPAAPTDSYPLSFAQQRLWFLSQTEAGSLAYNMPITYKIRGPLDVEALRQTWRHLIARHEILRTLFVLPESETGKDPTPRQVIVPTENVHLPFQYQDLREQVEPELVAAQYFEEESNRCFDLQNGPLWRILLFRTAEETWSIMFHFHHIISDGWSLEVTMDEQQHLYQAFCEGNTPQLPAKTHDYKDYACWEQALDLSQAQSFWLDLLENHHGPLRLPYDRPGKDSDFLGAYKSFQLDPLASARLAQLAKEHATTLPNLIFALWAIALSRFADQNSFNIGYADAGRRRPELVGILGFFVNLLVFPVSLEEDQTFDELLQTLTPTLFDGLEHGRYPYNQLVHQLNPRRNAGAGGLLNTVFGYQRFGSEDRVHHALLNPKGLFGEQTEVTSLFNEAFSHGTAKFDLTLFTFEHEHQLQFGLEYNAGTFTDLRVQRLIHFFQALLAGIGADSSPADIDRLIREKTPSPLPSRPQFGDQPDDPMARFKIIAKLFPKKAAITDGYRTLSYGELHHMSLRFAAWLDQRFQENQGPRQVALIMDTAPDLGWVVLGILRAGAAYIPINPGLPHAHIQRLLANPGVTIIVTDYQHQRVAEELLWDIPSLNTLFNAEPDGKDQIEAAGQLGDVTLWDYVGNKAEDDIQAGGWQDSFTGEDFSREVMDDYGDGALEKLKLLITPQTRVLEIGCASGITLQRIAPLVGRYVGTDLSPRVLEHSRRLVESRGWDHVRLACLEALDIDDLDEADFDLIIINSVVQCFPGYNYLREVLRKCGRKSASRAHIFLGDVMDLSRKQAMIHALRGRQGYLGESKSKIDWSNELFLNGDMLRDFAAEQTWLRDVVISEKNAKVDSELSRYRFDILLTLDHDAATPALNDTIKRFGFDDLPFNPAPVKAPLPEIALIHHTPKHNIPITRSGIANLVLAQGPLRIDFRDRVHLVHQPFEEVHIYELFGALLNGAEAFISPEEVLADAQGLIIFWCCHEITVALLRTPSLHDLIEEQPGAIDSLRLLVTGGAPLDTQRLKPVLELCTETKIVYAWGPSEACVIAAAHIIKEIGTDIPIGRALPGYHIQVRDRSGNPAAPGITGDLDVAGIGLYAGYIGENNHPDFVFDPEQGITYFKTGQRGRVNENGQIELVDSNEKPDQGTQEVEAPISADNNPMAEQIRRIWSLELKQPNIGDHDNFFDIGGHSLKAVRVLHRMQDTLARHIPLAMLFNHPSIAGLVSALQSTSDQAEWLMLTEDHPARPDIFFIPPGIGQPMIFRAIANHISDRYNGVGMFYPSDREQWTLETMAQSIFHGIMRRRRRGDIYLVGYSLGCNLAFEIGKMLENHGHHVSIIMIDGIVLTGQTDFGADRNREIEQWLKTWRFDDRGEIEASLHACFKAVQGRHTEGRISGDILAIEAADNPIATNMETWECFTDGSFHHLRLPGNHFTLLMDEVGNLAKVATQIETQFKP